MSDALRRRAEVLRAEQDNLTELIAEVAFLGGYWQGAAHVCAQTGCPVCREIAYEVAA